jgi:uncharacterized protein (TIGR02117 family)
MIRPFRVWPAALLVLLLSGCQNIALRPATVPMATAPAATASVYIVRRAWHIDIGFAATDLQPPLRSLSAAVPQAQYLEFGFGDRHYLLTRTHGTTTLLAAVWPGASLILMTALKATPQQAFGAKHVVVLRISETQAASIQNFIWNSMAASTVGSELAPVAEGPYPGSVFYAGTQRYSGLHTCNTWAAEALRAGKLHVHSSGVLLAEQLWPQVRRLATEAPQAGPQAGPDR